ncbi:MAG: D-aminoacyl-tRNA deacylase [Anaerolineae bacterium]
MRAVIQRVTQASVAVEGQLIAQIGRGFLVLVGVTHTDGRAEADWLARKIAGLRVFDDEAGKMNLALADVSGEVLVVSQFTLYADARKGRRPDFLQAARPEVAEPLVAYFVARLREQGLRVATGRFQAVMQVALVNDGPVTLWLDTADVVRGEEAQPARS